MTAIDKIMPKNKFNCFKIFLSLVVDSCWFNANIAKTTLIWKIQTNQIEVFTFFYLAIFLVFWRFWPFLVPKKGIRQTFFKKWILLSCSAWKTMQFSFSHHRLKINIFWVPEQAHRFTGYLISHPGVVKRRRRSWLSDSIWVCTRQGR